MRYFSPIIISQSIVLAAHAQYPMIDATYGDTGVALVGSSNSLYVNAAELTSNDQIVLVGTDNTVPVIARFDIDGVLDTTFGVQGVVIETTLGEPTCLVLQSDGKIIVGGKDQNDAMMIIRYAPNGDRDTTFGNNGFVSTPGTYVVSRVNGLALDDSDRVYSMGTGSFGSNPYYASIWRFHPDGVPDSTFGNLGNGELRKMIGTIAGAYCMVRLPGGNWMVGGGTTAGTIVDPFFLRITTDGIPDAGFGSSGVLLPSDPVSGLVYDIMLDPSSRVLFAGYTGITGGPTKGFLAGRMDADAVPDPTFGTNGLQKVYFSGNQDRAKNIVLRPDGGILLGGSAQILSDHKPAIVALTADGQVDSSFADQGVFVPGWGYGQNNEVLLQSDGKLLLTGYLQDPLTFQVKMAVARYDHDFATHVVNFTAPTRPHLQPVPADDHLTLTWPHFARLDWRIMDATGRLSLHGSSMGSELRIVTDRLPPGFYVLIGSSDQPSTTFRENFVVAR